MKNLLRTVALLLIVASATTQNTFAKVKSVKALDIHMDNASQYVIDNPLEKVYLHMDNTSYFMGDTLWFKAYAVNATQNKPTEESGILHVELLNPEGVIVCTQKYRLKGGKCAGSMPIDRELLSGFFEIRAYTKAMLNFDTDNYFTRVFPIFDGTQKNPEILDRLRTVGYIVEKPTKLEMSRNEKEMNSLPKHNITFYPEGGNLVMGLWSTIAFQVRDESGKPVTISGKIYDNSGAVADVKSEHLGIGTFDMMPSKSRYYMMIDGDDTQYDLPQPFKKGSVVSVDNITDDKSVEISVSSIYSNAVRVIILSQGKVTFTRQMTKGKSLHISKSKLNEGVNQVILYDMASGKEVASRLFYVRNSSLPKVYIEAQQSGSPAPNAQQEVTFKVSNEKGSGVETDFSLAIYDNETSLGNPQNSLYTSLLLSSEVRGYIPNADYYFEADDEERSRNLDLVMMVYGWSRYKWETMVESTEEESLFKYEKTLSVYGRVFKQKWESHYEISDSRNEYTMDNKFFDGTYAREITLPSREVMPYTDHFLINFAATRDDSLVYNPETLSISTSYMTTKMLSRKNVKQSNRFNFNYSDFFHDVNIAMNLNLLGDHVNKNQTQTATKGYSYYDYYKRSDLGLTMESGFFILDSEFRPDERDYDYDETNLGYDLKPMVEYPRILTRYYNRGKYSPFYETFNFSVFDQLTNRPYTSVERFLDYYCEEDFMARLKGTAYHSEFTMQNNVDNGYTSPNELLCYYKQPYGTVSYFATMVDQRSEGDNKYTTKALYNEVMFSTWRNTIHSDVCSYVIDSTVISNSLERRTELYERYKDDENFKSYSIKHLKIQPEKVFANKLPDYIVEHYGRLIDTPKGIHISAYRDVERDQRKRVFVFQGLDSDKREFYSPDYSTATPPASGDHRRTLYWNPNVESDAQGNATVTFYNNSQGGSYTIDAQTITANGEMGATTR